MSEAQRAKQSILWPKFTEFCEEQGIDLLYEEDWLPWWQCFAAGGFAHATATLNLTKEKKNHAG